MAMLHGSRESEVIRVGDIIIKPGTSGRADLPVANLPTQNQASIPIQVVHGSRTGPRFWVAAAIHGDEINGVEIVRELFEKLDPKNLCGTVFAVPIVNVFGFLYESRYLPDRRDLNRSFPGSPSGSMASRLADLFMTEIVDQCTHGIDLHTGSNDRINLPHIRGDFADEETRRCAAAFAAPVMIGKEGPEGSLRRAAHERGKVILTFEGGEPRRFNDDAVAVGVEGVLRVMDAIGMREHHAAPLNYEPRETFDTTWLRADRAGILRLRKHSGDFVKAGECLASIGDAFDANGSEVFAPFDGIIISHIKNPLIYEGDAMIHLAALKD
jgi:predicted deacylase